MKKKLLYLFIALLFCSCFHDTERKLVNVSGKYMLSVDGAQRQLLYKQTLIVLKQVDSVGFNKEYVLGYNGSYQLISIAKEKELALTKDKDSLSREFDLPKLESVADFLERTKNDKFISY